MLFHQVGDIIRGQAGVVDAFRVDHQVWAMLHRVANARGFQHLDFVDQTLRDQLVLQRVDELRAHLYSSIPDQQIPVHVIDKKPFFHLSSVDRDQNLRTSGRAAKKHAVEKSAVPVGELCFNGVIL